MFTKTTPAQSLLTVLVVSVLLYFGKSLFVPFFFALLIGFIVYPICKWLEKKGISRSISIFIALFIALLPIAGIVFLLVQQVDEIRNNWSFISEKIAPLLQKLGLPDVTAMSTDQRDNWLKGFLFKNPSEVYSVALSSVTALVQLVLIPFYAALLLYYRTRFVNFLPFIFPQVEPSKLKKILQETVTAYFNFIKGMILVYLIVGTLNTLGLLLLQIPHPVVYGFTASILTFIPYVGIIIGSVMPVITAWALHDSIYYPLGVIAIFTFVQFLEAYFIFPFAVSSRIKVNTLATLLVIFLGGIIWGASGMILFIPFLAILKLIAEKTEKLHPIAKVLGDDDDQLSN